MESQLPMAFPVGVGVELPPLVEFHHHHQQEDPVNWRLEDYLACSVVPYAFL